ncbi:hypothetical protein ABFX02_10G116900 [Erythranthe guttata]
MDWHSWLSKTNLEPTIAYEYGQAFIRNELQFDDINHFNHEFLQSIGISIAKHRLEILKLARKNTKGFSKLVLAMNKITRKLFAAKSGFHEKSPPTFRASGGLSPYNRSQWSGSLKRVNNNIGAKEYSNNYCNNQDQKYSRDVSTTTTNTRNVMWSGPLERRVLMTSCRSNSVSGPLDGRMQMYPNWSPIATRRIVGPGFISRSPTISGPIDSYGLSPKVNYYNGEKLGYEYDDDGGGDGVQSLWSLMFQDMKPT